MVCKKTRCKEENSQTRLARTQKLEDEYHAELKRLMPGKDFPQYHRTKLEEVILNAGGILSQTSERGQKIFMNKDVVDLKRSAGGLKTLRNKL